MQYYAWRFVTALLARLPLRVSYAVAEACGWIAYAWWPRGRRATTRNFRHILPGANASYLARRSLSNYCRYLVDFARMPSLQPSELLAAAHEVDGCFTHLSDITATGRGVVIVAVHFGNWDLGAAATAARGHPLAVVGESFPDARLTRAVFGARERLGMKVLPLESLGPSLFKSLRRGGLLALLIDRPGPGDGVTVPFFGREVDVPAGPARIARRSGAAVLPCAFPRRDPWHADIDVHADFSVDVIPTDDEEADIRRITAAIMAAHERFIRHYPDQWYMFRDMWPAKETTSVRQ